MEKAKIEVVASLWSEHLGTGKLAKEKLADLLAALIHEADVPEEGEATDMREFVAADHHSHRMTEAQLAQEVAKISLILLR